MTDKVDEIKKMYSAFSLCRYAAGNKVRVLGSSRWSFNEKQSSLWFMRMIAERGLQGINLIFERVSQSIGSSGFIYSARVLRRGQRKGVRFTPSV